MGVMVINATFNNISVISWWSVLLVDETGVPWEKHQSVTSHRQTLSYYVVSSTPRLSGIQTHMLVAIGTDCICSYKSNYNMITTTTAPLFRMETIQGLFIPNIVCIGIVEISF
jgi:hypothetical protein